MAKDRETVICPHCGEEIDRRAAACPHCGSDENTGWSENTYLDGIDTGDEIDYDEMVEQEFGAKQPGKKKKKISWQMVVGALVLIAFIAILLRVLV
jgi:uncharacterized membrane protein YvbJ